MFIAIETFLVFLAPFTLSWRRRLVLLRSSCADLAAVSAQSRLFEQRGLGLGSRSPVRFAILGVPKPAPGRRNRPAKTCLHRDLRPRGAGVRRLARVSVSCCHCPPQGDRVVAAASDQMAVLAVAHTERAGVVRGPALGCLPSCISQSLIFPSSLDEAGVSSRRAN